MSFPPFDLFFFLSDFAFVSFLPTNLLEYNLGERLKVLNVSMLNFFLLFSFVHGDESLNIIIIIIIFLAYFLWVFCFHKFPSPIVSKNQN